MSQGFHFLFGAVPDVYMETVLTTREHLKGYREALQTQGIPFDESLFLYGDFTEQEGYDCAQKLDIRGKGITAIACGSDAIAIGVIHYLSERGVRVPEDVSIIGIGDIPHSKFMVPPLTTLHVPRYEMGVRAVEIITRQEEPMLGEKILFTPTLMERKSVATLKSMSI